MLKLGKSLLTFLVMGIPLWVVVVGLYQYQPSSLVVHLEESDVRLFLGGEEYSADAGVLGPIDLKPGDYQMVVARGSKTLFSYPISIEEGHSKEVWAHWKTGGAPKLRDSGIQGVFQAAPKDLKGKRG